MDHLGPDASTDIDIQSTHLNIIPLVAFAAIAWFYHCCDSLCFRETVSFLPQRYGMGVDELPEEIVELLSIPGGMVSSFCFDASSIRTVVRKPTRCFIFVPSPRLCSLELTRL